MLRSAKKRHSQDQQHENEADNRQISDAASFTHGPVNVSDKKRTAEPEKQNECRDHNWIVPGQMLLHAPELQGIEPHARQNPDREHGHSGKKGMSNGLVKPFQTGEAELRTHHCPTS